MFYRASLDWLNFFLADVRGGLGAYVGGLLADAGTLEPGDDRRTDGQRSMPRSAH
jgi:hypothetical protein